MRVGPWLLWLTYLGAWTWALLVPNPPGLVRALLFPDAAPTPDGAEVRWQLLLILQSFHFSKVVHVVGYAGFAVCSAWLRLPRRFRWVLLLFLSIHAVGTELLQNLEPTRHPSWRDVGLDHLGIALGLALTAKWWLERP